MTDDIKARLEETAATCLKCYEAWNGQKKDSAASEALQDAVHELRKVASRLEIELAISERDETTQKRIPIPSHRDSRNRHQSGNNQNGQGGNTGNTNKPSGSSQKPRRRTPLKKPATGSASGNE